MKARHSRSDQGPVLQRLVGHRLSVVLFFSLATAILILGKAQTRTAETIRIYLIEAVTPVMNVMASPVFAFNQAMDRISGLARIEEENQFLKNENLRLMRWQAAARQLEKENAALRELLEMRKDPNLTSIAARILSDPAGPFVRTVLLNAGRRDGVEKGQALVTADGLAGRISSVGARSSRALLLGDLNSRVPVVLERTRERAMLVGDNSAFPRIMFKSINSEIQVGDRIMTSGHGGLFPPGLAVGMVQSVSDNLIQVKPYVDEQRMEYANILDYGMRRVIGQGPLAADKRSVGKEGAGAPARAGDRPAAGIAQPADDGNE